MSNRRVILLSQGEVRPGVVQGQHWGYPPIKAQFALSSSMYRDASQRLILRGTTQQRPALPTSRRRIWPF